MKAAIRIKHRPNRIRLSTTIASDTYQFLQGMVHQGHSLAEVLDAAIKKLRRLDNRERLAHATSQYFDCLEPHAVEEENALAKN